MKFSVSYLIPVVAALMLSTAHADPVTGCPVAPEDPVLSFFALAPTLELFKKLEGYKDSAAVDRYVECWKKSPELHRLYLTKYKPMIQRAADATGVPFAILACLFFVESRFDKNGLSRSGALGLTQFMPTTWRDQLRKLDPESVAVRNIYMADNIRKYVPKGSALDGKATEFETFFKEAMKDGKISESADLARLESLLKPFLSSKNPKLAEVAEQYVSYIQAAQDARIYRNIYARYFERAGKTTPKLNLKEMVKPEHRSDEELSIILSALYLKMDVFRGIYGREVRTPTRDQYIIATGGYNVGPAAIKCTTRMSADDCIKITKPLETSNQMKSVRNCSEHRNQNPMPMDEKGGVRECQKNI